MSIFERIKALGIEYDNHYSDLYFPKTAETTKIVNIYEFKDHVTTFKDNITGAIWYDVPFAYDPYWNEVRVTMSMPNGWAEIKGALTAPLGTIWISNNKSYFAYDENGNKLRKQALLIVDDEIYKTSEHYEKANVNSKQYNLKNGGKYKCIQKKHCRKSMIDI